LKEALSPIEEEDKEDNVYQERDPLVDALFPFGSEEDHSGSQRSIKGR
jgi:hypothetical protein